MDEIVAEYERLPIKEATLLKELATIKARRAAKIREQG